MLCLKRRCGRRHTSFHSTVGVAVGLAASMWLSGQIKAEERESPNASAVVEQIYRQCGERWGVPGAIAECLLEKEREFGKQLDQFYRQAIVAAGNNAALLRESQRNWLKYQDSNCRYHEKRLLEEGPGVARLSYARCLRRVLINAGIGRMSALGANRTRRDGGNDVNDPNRTESGLKSRSAAVSCRS
jgi:uncharacterized protein YecT (DUF1311 family)